MTITINGPDGSTFNFPDDTAPDVISGAMAKHYGAPQAQTAPDAGPLTSKQGAKELIRGIPIAGPWAADRAPAALQAAAQPWLGTGQPGATYSERYGRNLPIEQAQREAAEAAHPAMSTALQLGGGAAALGPLGEWAPAARALGMTGRLATAAPTAAVTGAGIGAADALARGEDPTKGAIGGALSGAGGVVGGKAIGMIYDAARGAFRPAAAQRYLPGGPVAGVDVPVTESTITRDPNTARSEEAFRKQGITTATQADQATNQAMQQAHANFGASLDPTAQSTGAQPLDAGEAAAGDIVQQEQARAAAEVARMTGARGATQPIRAGLAGGAAAPMSVSDVGDMVSQGVSDRFAQARAARTAAYRDYGNVPGEFNPRDLLNMGERNIRPALNDPTSVGLPRSDRVYVKPELMPNTSAALQTIDHEMGQLALTNEVARGNRPITSEDIEEVRKLLVQYQGAANAAARAGAPNGWQDARGMQRLMQEFDRHMLDVVTRPGGFSGDAQAYMDAQAAARQSHADLRSTFSRQMAGDKVGTFMENVLGKVPGQEMSGDKIMQTLLGSPDKPGTEMSAPILAHLRDNVFGANSPEWNQIRQAAIAHMTDTPAGAEPVALDKIASRLERFLGNDRQASELLTPNERTELAQHAANLRSAPDEPPVAGSPEALLSGITTGQQLMSKLFGGNGAQVAAALRDRLMASGSEDVWNQLRQGVWQRVAEAPAGMIPWEHQRTGQQIAKFLNTPLAREMFTANERAVMSSISNAHLQIVPVKGSTNPSGTAFMNAHLAKGMRRQLINMLGFATHGIHGLITSTAVNRAWDEASQRMAAKEAERLFIGRHPRVVTTAGQRIGATIAPQITRQSSQ